MPSLGHHDDLVTGAPALPIIDSLQFRHNYLTKPETLQFLVLAVFSSSDTSVLSGGNLPLSPDPRLQYRIEDSEISILDSRAPATSLSARFTSLVRLPTTIPEPGSLALLCLGCAGLWAARRSRADRAG